MPEAIADTSVLIFLHKLGHLDLLRTFYGRVLVPRAVVAELQEGAAHTPAPPLAELPWIVQRAVARTLVPPSDLGPGEVEVVALGLEHPGLAVILDDGRARAYAKRFELRVTGTLGILARAVREGFVADLAPELDRLENFGFRMTPQLRRMLLEHVGEQP